MALKLERSPKTYLILFTALYAFAQFCSSRSRLFWIDELFTYHLANLPSISQIWPLIQKGIELNPPLPFWLTWIVHHTLGGGEFLTRLPAITGFWGMCLCLFFCVRRLSDSTFAFVALLLPLFTYTDTDATWARGYGLLLFFSSAALLFWQMATDGRRRRITLILLAGSLAAALSCHYYAAYVIFTLMVAEAVRTWQRRRIDVPIWLALFGGATPLLAYIPLLRAVGAGSKHFWVKPDVRFLYSSYADLGPATMSGLLLLAACLCIRNNSRDHHWDTPVVGLHELTAYVLLAAMPLAIFIGSLFTPLAFYSRYVQPVVIGYSVLIALFLYRVGGGNQKFRNTLITILVWFCFVPWLGWHMLRGITAAAPWDVARTTLGLPAAAPSMPFIIDDDADFSVAYHYAPKDYRDHLYFLYDPASAIKYLGSDTGQKSMVVGQTFHDFHVVSYSQFLLQNKHFMIERSSPGGWVVQKLLEDGADLRLVEMRKPFGVFTEGHMLLEAHVNSPRK